MVTYQDVYEEIAAKVGALSVEQLLALQDIITARLREKLGGHLAENPIELKQPELAHKNTSAVKLVPDLEEIMLEIVTPEEWAEIKADLESGKDIELPELPKPLTHYLIEDRG